MAKKGTQARSEIGNLVIYPDPIERGSYERVVYAHILLKGEVLERDSNGKVVAVRVRIPELDAASVRIDSKMIASAVFSSGNTSSAVFSEGVKLVNSDGNSRYRVPRGKAVFITLWSGASMSPTTDMGCVRNAEAYLRSLFQVAGIVLDRNQSFALAPLLTAKS